MVKQVVNDYFRPERGRSQEEKFLARLSFPDAKTKRTFPMSRFSWQRKTRCLSCAGVWDYRAPHDAGHQQGRQASGTGSSRKDQTKTSCVSHYQPDPFGYNPIRHNCSRQLCLVVLLFLRFGERSTPFCGEWRAACSEILSFLILRETQGK